MLSAEFFDEDYLDAILAETRMFASEIDVLEVVIRNTKHRWGHVCCGPFDPVHVDQICLEGCLVAELYR